MWGFYFRFLSWVAGLKMAGVTKNVISKNRCLDVAISNLRCRDISIDNILT